MMTEREKWTKIEQEEGDFHSAYQFDNTVWNLQEDNDGTDELLASIENVSISTEQNKVRRIKCDCIYSILNCCS